MAFLRNYRTVCSLILNDDLLSTAVAEKTVYRQLCVFGKLSSSCNSLHFHTHTHTSIPTQDLLRDFGYWTMDFQVGTILLHKKR